MDNYKAILSSSEFWGVLWNTFRYIIMYIPLMLVASLGVAYLLSRQRRGVTAFRIIYYIPVLTSWVAASMIWKSMLSPEYGAVNNILAIFGIQGPGWLLDEAWAMPGHCTGVSLEGYGVLWPHSPVRHGGYQQSLL